MAALDTPWMSSMSDAADGTDATSSGLLVAGEAATYAPFSPTTASTLATSSRPSHRSTILIHQKSPLLLATPPQITRALAHSHPFLEPLNKLLGLLAWNTEDPWESFLLLATFWAVTLYVDVVLKYAGPLLLVGGLILGMYSRRFSALSTNAVNHSAQAATSSNHSRQNSAQLVGRPSNTLVPAVNSRHHKSLDDILGTLQTLTARCNILLDPLVFLTDFLSTQRTATSSTTGPALITLFIRLLFLTPIWIALTLPPFRIITTKRITLAIGTLILSWHSQPSRVSRLILWRSRVVRKTCGYITGLSFPEPSVTDTNTEKSRALARSVSQQNLNRRGKSRSADLKGDRPEAIRFTFALYENQRRWLGIGWTPAMLAYERASWTDEELNPTPPKDEFKLPSVDGGIAVWRWVDEDVDQDDGSDRDGSVSDMEDGSRGWQVEIDATVGPQRKSQAGPSSANSTDSKSDAAKRLAAEREAAWIYTDTKWRYPKRADGWGKYTRRRKWVRAAELVDSSGVISSSPPRSSYLSSATATADYSRNTLRAAPPLPRRPTTLTMPLTPQSGITAGFDKIVNDDLETQSEHGHGRQESLGWSTPATPGTPSSSPPKKSSTGGWFSRKKTSDLSGAAAGLDSSLLSGAQTPSSPAAAAANASSHEAILSKAFSEKKGSSGAGAFSISSSLDSRGSGGGGGGGSADEGDGYVPLRYRGRVETGWGMGEDAGANLS